jgi:hypothetical protein
MIDVETTKAILRKVSYLYVSCKQVNDYSAYFCYLVRHEDVELMQL